MGIHRFDFCLFRMADHEVISYWKLGDTSLRDQRNQRLSETVNTGGVAKKKKKRSIKKSCPIHVQQDKTASRSRQLHYWTAF